RGRDGHRATVHAAGTRDPAAEVVPRAHPPGSGAEPGDHCGAVGTTVLRARAAGLAWAQVEALDDEALHARVYRPPTPPTRHRPLPDCAYLHAERRKPGVTLELLHLEYLEQHPDGDRYTQFCEVYR